ncbi:hypothetical protein MTLP_07450 [Candidatus Methanoliparum sp. LAM-1]|nr:hypothetical protein MTLP_07450 [Candidatus Methanoliparum sp. LAM-1]
MRKDLIKQIQSLRSSKLIIYFTGDSHPVGFSIKNKCVSNINRT